MVIHETDEWWTGSEPSDIQLYLAEYTKAGDGYPAIAFCPVVCPCGSIHFRLVRAGTITKRTCVECAQERYISRSGDSLGWEEAIENDEPEDYICVGCGGNEVNVCVGFADYARHPGFKNKPASPLPDAVLWFFVGVRCSTCGVLGSFNDGKVGRGPFAESTFREITGDKPAKGGQS